MKQHANRFIANLVDKSSIRVKIPFCDPVVWMLIAKFTDVRQTELAIKLCK